VELRRRLTIIEVGPAVCNRGGELRTTFERTRSATPQHHSDGRIALRQRRARPTFIQRTGTDTSWSTTTVANRCVDERSVSDRRARSCLVRHATVLTEVASRVWLDTPGMAAAAGCNQRPSQWRSAITQQGTHCLLRFPTPNPFALVARWFSPNW